MSNTCRICKFVADRSFARWPKLIDIYQVIKVIIEKCFEYNYYYDCRLQYIMFDKNKVGITTE